MNRENLGQLARNYTDNFDFLNNKENDEKYKWAAIEKVQKHWDLSAPNLAEMIQQSFSLSENLINNRIVQPVSGLVAVSRVEPKKVQSALTTLLSDTIDTDQKQDQIMSFVDSINLLLEKNFPGKWKYEQRVRDAICYLAMIKPSENFLFKSTPAHDFARYMKFGGDIGYGQDFKLRNYYAMCNELVAYIQSNSELVQINRSRQVNWKDDSYHVFAYDLIYCFSFYKLNDGMKEPVPLGKPSTLQQRRYREQQAEELQKQLDGLQDQIDSLQQDIGKLPDYRFEGQSLMTKAFGVVLIEKQENERLFFSANGQPRKFALPQSISDGYLIPEDPSIIDRYKKQAKLEKQIDGLEAEQRSILRIINQLLA